VRPVGMFVLRTVFLLTLVCRASKESTRRFLLRTGPSGNESAASDATLASAPLANETEAPAEEGSERAPADEVNSTTAAADADAAEAAEEEFVFSAAAEDDDETKDDDDDEPRPREADDDEDEDDDELLMEEVLEEEWESSSSSSSNETSTSPSESSSSSSESEKLLNEKWTLTQGVARGDLDHEMDVAKVEEWIEAIPPDGAAIVRTEMLSVDAFARTKARAATPGEALPAMGVGVVERSTVSSLRPGARVVGQLGAQKYATVFYDTLNDKPLGGVSQLLKNVNPKLALGLCGASTGLAAYLAVHRASNFRKKDVVVVTAAHTAMGAIASKLFRRAGAKLCIGLAPGKDLCDRLVALDVVDVAVDTLLENEALAKSLDDALVPDDKVDLVFDCGGRGFDFLLLDRLNRGARVLVCAPSIREDDDDRNRDAQRPSVEEVRGGCEYVLSSLLSFLPPSLPPSLMVCGSVLERLRLC